MYADMTMRRKTLETFDYLPLEGRVDLADPEVEFLLFEDCGSLSRWLNLQFWLRRSASDDWIDVHTREQRIARDGQFRTLYFGRRVSQPSDSVHTPSIQSVRLTPLRSVYLVLVP